MKPILDLAQRQGYITTAQALGLGGHEHTLGRLVDAGELIRTIRGTFLTAIPRSPEAAHALVTRIVLETDPWSAASHHSALSLHGVPLFGVPWSQVHVADPRKSSRRHASIHRHVLRPGDSVIEVDGLKTTGLPLALCQTAARFGMVSGLVAMDHALQRALCTRADLADVIASGRLRRGIGAARRAVALADARSESPGESRLRAIVAEGPYDFDLQVTIAGPGARFRVDLLVDGRVAVEYDGELKYEGPAGHQAVIAEKRREDWIRAQGFGFVRVMKQELEHPVALRRAIHTAVLEARARRTA